MSRSLIRCARGLVAAALVGVMCLAFSPAPPVSAFAAYPSWLWMSSPHDQITKLAATRADGWAASTTKSLQYAVRQPDWNENGWVEWFTFGPNANYDASHHCDRNPPGASGAWFLATSNYIRAQTDLAVADTKVSDFAGAIAALGRALHAVQDCQAHSNHWELTPLDKLQFKDTMWDTTGTEVPPADLKLTAYDPNAADPEAPGVDTYSHAANAKDTPTKNPEATAHYQEAFDVAVTYSRDVIDRVMAGLNPAEQFALKNASVSNGAINAKYEFAIEGSCGPSGCTLSGSGTTVQFQPGTFASSTPVALLGPDNTFFSSPDDVQAPDGTWMVVWREIRPEEGRFSPPAMGTLQYTSAQIEDLDETTLMVYAPDSATGVWAPVPTTLDTSANTVRFTVSAGGTYALGGKEGESPPVPAPNVPGALAFGAMAVLAAALFRRRRAVRE